MVLRKSRTRKSRSPCRYGRKKSMRRGCKSRPGPKRRSRRRSRKQLRRRSMKKTSRCRYGRKKSMRRGCKSRPGPKRRSVRRSRRRRSVRRSRRRRRSLRYNYRAADRLPFNFSYGMNGMLNQEGIPGFLENDAVEIESVRQVNNINYFRLRDEEGNVVSDENGNRKWFTNTPDSQMDYIEFEVIEDPNILYQLGN